MTTPLLAMARRFERIGAERMRELPIYNHALDVEVVGFHRWGPGYIGVLITPWFMNLMLLPAEKEQWDGMQLGDTVTHELPSGEHDFMVGDDEELGVYQFITLVSPVASLKTQAAARTAALVALGGLLRIGQVPEKPAVDEQPVTFHAQDEPDAGRRAFLRGFAGKDGGARGGPA
jgi:[NiFe] hydrogenase assembly HybE family chaperone